MLGRLSLLGASILAACSASSASTSDDALTMNDLPVAVSGTKSGAFDQILDHDHADGSLRFKQRYWYTTEFGTGPESPVLYYFCGEQTCGPWALERMADTAKSLHANVVALEHRYYGRSRPFAGKLTLDQIQYLSMHQALEDAATFEEVAKRELGFGGKWIAVGGSYSGMLAAFYRDKHPELVVGAWASSAPVDMRTSFWGGDALSARALGPVCLPLFQQALAAASAAYDDPEQRKALVKALFDMDEWKDEWGKGSFLSWISSAARGAAQGGESGRLCQSLQQHLTRPLDGVAAYNNPPLVPDDAPATSTTKVARPNDAIGPGARIPRAADEEEDADDQVGMLWGWQSCTEVGFFEVRNPDPTLSVFIADDGTEADALDWCQQRFKRVPDVARARATYFEPLRAGHVSNILYVNGAFDPWSSLSFTDPLNPPPGSTVFVIAQGAHHDELTNLKPDSPIPVFEAHVLFNKLAKQWLAE